MGQRSVVHSDPDILGGTPVFVGTRVPVQALIDYIEGGHSLDEFLDAFPTINIPNSHYIITARYDPLSIW